MFHYVVFIVCCKLIIPGAELKNILSIDIRTIQGLKSFAVKYKLDLSDGTNYDSYYSLFSKIKEHLTEHGFVAPVEGLHRIAAALKTLKEDVASVDSMLHAGLNVNLVISPLCLDTLRTFSRSLCHLNSSHTKIYLIDELSRALSTVDDELKTIDSKLLSVYVKGESRTVWAPFKERMKAIMKGAVAFCQGSPLVSQYLDSAYLEKKNITIDNILDVVGKRGKLSFFPLVFTDATRIIPKEVKAFLNLLVIYVSFGYTGSDIVSRKLFTSTENTVSVLQTYNECVEKYFPKFEKMGFHQQAVIGLKYFPQFKNSLGLVFSDDSKMSTSILPGMLKDFLNTRQSLATRQVSFSVLLDVNEFVNPSPPESIDGLPAALANSTATEPMPPLDDDEQNGETVVNPTFPLVMSSLPFKRKMTFNSAVEREQFVRDATAAMLDVYTNVFRHSPGVDVVTAFQDSYLKVKEKLKRAKAKKQEGINESSTDDSDEE
jgi:hypothetical protein